MEYIYIVDGSIYNYFKEYMLSFIKPENIKFAPYDVKVGDNIIYVQRFLGGNYKKANSMGLLNMEQLSKRAETDYIKWTLNINHPNYKLYDYSYANAQIMKENNIDCTVLPYKYNAFEIDKLKNMVKTIPKKYDFAFIGAGSPSRDRFLQMLRNKGYSVNVVNGWGDERDSQIAQSKYLLNSHYREDYRVFEEIRCNRWAMAGMPVISESCLYPDTYSHLENTLFQQTPDFSELSLYLSDIHFHINSLKPVLHRFFYLKDVNLPVISPNLTIISVMKDIPAWLADNVFFHYKYNNLNENDQLEYRKCYFMHYYGCGYSTNFNDHSQLNTQPNSQSYSDNFKKFNLSQCLALMYRNSDTCIFRRNTILTKEWISKVHNLIDTSGNIENVCLKTVFEQIKEKYKSLILFV